MIMYARALYLSFKSGLEKFIFPHTFCLLSIRTYEARMIMYARALYRNFQSELDWKSLFSHTRFVYYQYGHTRRA